MHLIYLRNDYLSTKKRKKSDEYLKKIICYGIVRNLEFISDFFNKIEINSADFSLQR